MQRISAPPHRTREEGTQLLENNVAQEYESDAFLTLKQATEEISQSIENSKLSNKNELIKITTNQLKANLRLDKDITEQVLATKMQEITNNKGLIYTGELIISRGEQITEEKFQILSSLKDEYEGQNISKTKQYTITLGQFLLVVIALTAMMLFINHSNKEAYQDNRKITLILFVILFMSLIVASVLQINPKYIYTVPLCLTPIIIRTFFNTKTALYVLTRRSRRRSVSWTSSASRQRNATSRCAPTTAKTRSVSRRSIARHSTTTSSMVQMASLQRAEPLPVKSSCNNKLVN